MVVGFMFMAGFPLENSVPNPADKDPDRSEKKRQKYEKPCSYGGEKRRESRENNGAC